MADVLVDPVACRVGAFEVQHGDGWFVQCIPAALVTRLGPHVILVAGSAGLEFAHPTVNDPAWLRAHTILGLEVLTEDGDRLGFVADAAVDRRTLAVTRYQVRRPLWGRWRRAGACVTPSDVLQCSAELMLVRGRLGRGPAYSARLEAQPGTFDAVRA